MDEKLNEFRRSLLRNHDRLVNSEREYEQGEAAGLALAVDLFDSYFGEAG